MKKIKDAFEGIRAEESLKKNTLKAIYADNKRKNNRAQSFAFKKAVLSTAAVLMAFSLVAITSHNLYFTETAYIDMDLNPSLAIAVNRFDRVIGIEAYNEEGEALQEAVGLKYKRYDDAVEELIEWMNQQGYLQETGLLSITLQKKNPADEEVMLEKIQTGAEIAVKKHHEAVEIEIFVVDEETREDACAVQLSPAKYIAIQELQELDETVSLEECRGHSLKELREQVNEHKQEHRRQRKRKGHGGNH